MIEKIAGAVFCFTSSWKFIIVFLWAVLGWGVYNTYIAAKAPDPYPYLFLNLLLNVIAALTAPLIMINQNKEQERDREQTREIKADIKKVQERVDLLLERLDK